MQDKKAFLRINLRTVGTCLIAGGMLLSIFSVLRFPPAGFGSLHYTTIIAFALELMGVLLLSRHLFSTDRGQRYSRLFLAVGLLTLVVVYFIVCRDYLI
ncbi:hypothetical protein H9Q13_05485 [Pontibacter sp. JH31]|uniref:Cytochrome C oxidase subunit IV n=1 Tax=Pontibacter aquaedesilientis TaxID=2766980 RepID=A0ABR7XGT7_9BACT|nr:hypothetical protein [Pontibacter aquaedesilientis]MBD1396611.1 hypothetical protein [Pontibacter aquaedesilientis]